MAKCVIVEDRLNNILFEAKRFIMEKLEEDGIPYDADEDVIYVDDVENDVSYTVKLDCDMILLD